MSAGMVRAAGPVRVALPGGEPVAADVAESVVHHLAVAYVAGERDRRRVPR